MQNQQMAMAGMNATGGPVGGTPMMNNGRPGHIEGDARAQLNTYIYDYFLKNHNYRLARLMIEQDMKMNLNPAPKPSPSGRNMNGVDSMDLDSKDDLPAPKIPDNQTADNSFLLDWWNQFWDMFSAARKGERGKPATHQYLAHTRASAQMRNDTQQRLLMQNNMGYRNMMQMPNGAVPNDLQRKAAMNNRTPAQMQQQMNQIKNQAMLQSASMQRDGSGMEMNGQRPQSPGSSENAPSPNKRPRVEGNNFNGQPMGAPRSQGMPQQPMGATSAGQNQMLLAGMNPGNMPGNGFNEFAQQTPNVQQKSIEVYTQSLAQQQRTALNNHTMAKGMNPVQGSPMGQPGLDGSGEIFTGNPGRMPGGAGPGQPQGNHALQDYQMQLMLLEQQNKKRLLMARQEQDNMQQGPHQAPVGAPGFAPAMSPQGSRAGPSPNPTDQMKRGTPKMGQQGLPGSPMPDGTMGQNRNSPAPNFDPSQMPAGMPPQFYPQVPPNMMRPPSSHPGGFQGQFSQQQMEAMARNGAMQNGGAWRPGGPQMMPNQGQQPNPMGTPQQRAMPPPPAPPAEQPARTQPPSPQQPAAPPTPSQASKPPPRKKDTKDTKKKPAKKNAANTGATPASEPDPPPTPTPSTPITPMHANSFSKGQNGQAQQQAQAPTTAPAPQVQAPPMDNTGAPFGNIGEDSFDLTFGVEGDNVLENFDFDSFLHTGDDSGGFGSLGNDFNFGADGVEAGIGEP